MASKLNKPIPVSAFIALRDKISEIITNELAYQLTTTSDNDYKVKVMIERNTPIDMTDFSTVVIGCDKVSYDSKHQGSKRGDATFNIDVYTNAASNASNPGDLRAAMKLHKLTNSINFILEDPVYKFLDLPVGIVLSSLISDVTFSGYDKQDNINSCYARMTFDIKFNENPTLLAGIHLTTTTTQVTFDTGTSGLKYQH